MIELETEGEIWVWLDPGQSPWWCPISDRLGPGALMWGDVTFGLDVQPETQS
jgi:hypothetical protein